MVKISTFPQKTAWVHWADDIEMIIHAKEWSGSKISRFNRIQDFPFRDHSGTMSEDSPQNVKVALLTRDRVRHLHTQAGHSWSNTACVITHQLGGEVLQICDQEYGRASTQLMNMRWSTSSSYIHPLPWYSVKVLSSVRKYINPPGKPHILSSTLEQKTMVDHRSERILNCRLIVAMNVRKRRFSHFGQFGPLIKHQVGETNAPCKARTTEDFNWRRDANRFVWETTGKCVTLSSTQPAIWFECQIPETSAHIQTIFTMISTCTMISTDGGI
jgi:hypothetical protein